MLIVHGTRREMVCKLAMLREEKECTNALKRTNYERSSQKIKIIKDNQRKDVNYPFMKHLASCCIPFPPKSDVRKGRQAQCKANTILRIDGKGGNFRVSSLFYLFLWREIPSGTHVTLKLDPQPCCFVFAFVGTVIV